MQNNIFSGAFVAQNLVTLKEVDSTNTYLKNILANSEPVPEGTVIMAESQYAGRGQQQNKWFAEPGKSLAFSLLLKPAFLPINQQFDLTRIVSLGVHDALQPLTGNQLKVKWPNDVYVNQRKLGGILIENQVQGSTLKSAIVGVGLNINTSQFPDWVPNAISLKQILHTDYDLKALLLEICEAIGKWYIKLQAGETSLIRQQYLQALYRFNEEHFYKRNHEVIEGRIVGVTDSGLLEVQQPDGVQRYNLKEIEFLNNP
ncbi:biotin--[acetyl-CoA-carboxylase] ligase [Mucilaginibacter robiniae]|uniref:biotin--[biotin carboxyl-carrier protein] ligase n=1 Tax=Mucilaginibacter robiniae TaxID=2728022 RepID=A0A7L5E3E3_9SPHI|nr:biotin--[acetyl-CoA-carboxylase] ligase [Mucilaginibacter robiniae]QJD97118.1 biotin--[acetyl-CoA-carboxylase] ligase [Mucilaginibacter robiniae]